MVNNSASLNFGAIPTSGRQIRSDGLVASSSSILTYSAVAKVSISVSTVTSQVESLVLATPIMDAFVASHVDPVTAGGPWNQSSRSLVLGSGARQEPCQE